VRVLTLTNCPLDPRLGSGKTVIAFSAGLRAAGCTVDVLTPDDFEPYQVRTGRAAKFRRAWYAWRAVPPRLAQSYDLIEFYGDEFWAVARQLRRAHSRPVLVAHTNGLELLAHARDATHRPPGRLRRWFDGLTHLRFSRIWLRSVDALVCLCEEDSRWAVAGGHVAADRAAVVEPGLDAEYLAGEVTAASTRGPRVAYSGSWIDRKGIDVLALAMANVLAARPKAHFDIFGAARSPPECIRAAFPEAVRARVTIHPGLSNRALAEGLGQAAIFVFPSRYEGYGLALAEAMARGCAAVTTPTGLGAGLADGQEAWVVGFDDAAALTSAVLQLLDNPTLCDRLAAGGRRRVAGLNWNAAGARLAALYESLVASSHHRHAAKSLLPPP
jgi:glycosyltransferase involved in cell wall biosynthesis